MLNCWISSRLKRTMTQWQDKNEMKTECNVLNLKYWAKNICSLNDCVKQTRLMLKDWVQMIQCSLNCWKNIHLKMWFWCCFRFRFDLWTFYILFWDKYEKSTYLNNTDFVNHILNIDIHQSIQCSIWWNISRMKRSDVRHLSLKPNSLNCCCRRQRTHIYQMTKSMLDVLSWWPKSWRMRSRRTLSNAQISWTIWWRWCEIQVNLLSYLKQQRQNESNHQSILTRWWKIILHHK